MSLSPREREMLDKAVTLRGIARASVAPYLSKTFNDLAEYLIALQRESTQRTEMVEALISCIEEYGLASGRLTSISLKASNIIKRYKELK